MKTVWVQVIPWNKSLVTAALEAGADGLVLEEGRSAETKAVGLTTTIAPDGDLTDVPRVRIEEWTGPVAQPVGAEFLAWGDRAVTGDPIEVCWRLAPDVVQETAGPVGAEDPAVIRVLRTGGLRPSHQVDTIEAGLLSENGNIIPAVLSARVSEILSAREPSDIRFFPTARGGR